MNENDNNVQSSTVVDLSPANSSDSIKIDNEKSLATRKHILVVGIVGSGKTRLIHLLTDKMMSYTGQSLDERTKSVNIIQQIHENVEYVFIDTPGFGGLTDTKDDTNNPLPKLFLYLASKETRFDCVLLVWKYGRIDKTFIDVSNLLKNKLIEQSTPFILAVTGCETEDDIKLTTDSIQTDLKNFHFDTIVCGTTLKGGCLEEHYTDIREQMHLDLWQNITKLCANRVRPVENASTEMETSTLLDFVALAWELVQNVFSYAKQKLTSAAQQWTIVNKDGTIEGEQEFSWQPSRNDEETPNTSVDVTTNPRVTYET